MTKELQKMSIQNLFIFLYPMLKFNITYPHAYHEIIMSLVYFVMDVGTISRVKRNLERLVREEMLMPQIKRHIYIYIYIYIYISKSKECILCVIF